ncbi:MAG TPA: hypothetical protein VKG89_09035 [Solirubrobacterales bacterium]|nr:hypothetical protein [Solirubrobacterales bacterium]
MAAGPELDDWLPNPQVRGRHRRAAEADPDRLWRAAGSVLLRDAPRLGRVVRWRIPGTSPDLSFREVLRSYPFAVLAEGERWSVSGLCGRLWTLRRDYPQLHGADEFRAWEEPGTARVLIAHWIEPAGDAGAALVSESRVEPTDRGAAFRLRALWAVVGHFDRLIGGEVLRAATALAQRP